MEEKFNLFDPILFPEAEKNWHEFIEIIAAHGRAHT